MPLLLRRPQPNGIAYLLVTCARGAVAGSTQDAERPAIRSREEIASTGLSVKGAGWGLYVR